MDSESAKTIEAEFRRRFKEAERLMDARRYDAALEMYDALDRDFPHRKEIIYERSRCLTAMGRTVISSIEDDKRRHAMVFDGEAEWHDEKIFPNLKPRIRRGVVAPVWEPRDYDSEDDFNQRPSEALYWLVVAGLVLILLSGVVRAVYGERAPGARATFAGMPFVWIPDEHPTPTSEGGAPEQGVWMARHELTQDEWRELIASEDDPFYWSENATAKSRPAENVDRDAIVAYLVRLNYTGEGYFRLPTEDEWERASRAGTDRGEPYFFGDAEGALRRYAWYRDAQPPTPGTWTVARRWPNPWGLYDMYGNVAEWCLDVAPVEQRALEQLGFLDSRMVPWVARGGHIMSTAEGASSFGRDTHSDTRPDLYTGLRLVREPGRSVRTETRTLKFPKERSLGTLYTLAGMEKTLPVPARGDVVAPVDARLRLEVSAEGLQDLSPLSELEPGALTEVAVEALDARDGEVDSLSHLALLEGLELGDNPNLGDLGVMGLSSLVTLDRLDLSRTAVSGEAMRHLWPMRVLRTLKLVSLSRVNDSHVVSLGRLASLRKLDVTGTSISDEGLGELQLLLPYCEITPVPPKPTAEQALRWASVRGKYGMLVHQFRADRNDAQLADLGQDRPGQTLFLERGFDSREDYGSNLGLEPGYWVFVEPYWYVWHETTEVLNRRDRDWGPEQVAGAPDAQGPQAAVVDVSKRAASVREDAEDPEKLDLLDPRRYWGDHVVANARAAWAPEVHDAPSDWLLVEFTKPVIPAMLEIYGPEPLGAIDSITFYDLEGRPTRNIAMAPPQATARGVTYVLPIEGEVLQALAQSGANRVRLGVTRTPLALGARDAVEIDALAVVDRDGERQWARYAHSSSYLGMIIDRLNALGIDSEERILYPDDIQFRGFFHLFTDLLKDNPLLAHPEWIESLKQRDREKAALLERIGRFQPE